MLWYLINLHWLRGQIHSLQLSCLPRMWATYDLPLIVQKISPGSMTLDSTHWLQAAGMNNRLTLGVTNSARITSKIHIHITQIKEMCLNILALRSWKYFPWVHSTTHLHLSGIYRHALYVEYLEENSSAWIPFPTMNDLFGMNILSAVCLILETISIPEKGENLTNVNSS